MKQSWRLARALAVALFAAAPGAMAAAPSHGDEVPPPEVVAQLERLAPQRPGIIDVYALLVGADGEEDVFRKEVAAARKVLDERLDTKGRSVTLVNRRASPRPEATLNSLVYALKRIAQRMDRDEDVLFLHITTHGSGDHVLSFRHPASALYGLSPAYLDSALREARVRYRAIVISACYSGGFVAPLANAETLVITAADRTRRSYGCGNDSEITDFSRAFYLKALRETRSLPEAARIAQRIVHAEEQADKRDHSYPQMRMGAAIAAQLRVLERRLAGD